MVIHPSARINEVQSELESWSAINVRPLKGTKANSEPLLDKTISGNVVRTFASLSPTPLIENRLPGTFCRGVLPLSLDHGSVIPTCR